MLRMDGTETNWTHIIQPKGRWLDLRLAEVWQYRYLVAMFVNVPGTNKPF